MADITRDIGEVSPNNYIRRGVEKPSPMSLVAAVGNKAIDLDVALSRERLAKESEDLRTRYEVGSPAAIAVQEGTQLTEGDQAQVAAIGGELEKKKAAVDQGRMTFERYRVEGERLLRMAISKRPGLAQDFRAVAAQHLGVDVVGASVDVLADAEKAMLAGGKDKGADDSKRARDQIENILGIPTAHMSDEQAVAYYGQHLDAIGAGLQQLAKKQIVQTEVAITDGSNQLKRPGATVAFVSQVQDAKVEVYKSFNQAYMAFQSGNAEMVKNMPAIIQRGNAEISGKISSLRMSMAQGDVDPAIAEKEILGLEELGRQMTDLASGKFSGEVLKNKLDGTMLYMQNIMMDNENVAVMAAAPRLFGPEITLQAVQPGGSFNKTAMLAFGNTLNNTGAPITRAVNAGTVTSMAIKSVLDRGGAASNPEAIPAMATTLINAGTSFVEIAPDKFRADYLTGPNGYLTVLGFHATALAKTLGPEQSQELLGSVSLAALSNYHALAVGIKVKYPSLKGKLKFGLDTATGDFITPMTGVKLTPTEQAAVRTYNRAFDGKKVLSIFQGIGGVDAETAKNLLFSGETTYQQVKAQKQKAAPAPQPNATASTGGGNWWENF